MTSTMTGILKQLAIGKGSSAEMYTPASPARLRAATPTLPPSAADTAATRSWTLSDLDMAATPPVA